jgi:hypothetical protein
MRDIVRTPVLLLDVVRSRGDALLELTRVGRVTTSEIVTSAGRPPESSTLAWIWCVPTESAELVKAPPAPITPSRFEVQRRALLRSPSSGSLALPLKSIGSSTRNPAPFAGAPIVAVGASLPGTLTPTQEALPESVYV